MNNTNFHKLANILNKDKKIISVFAVSIVCIVLLVISSIGGSNAETKNREVETSTKETMKISGMEEILEEKLCSIISNIVGAGQTKVMITLGSSGEYVYAENSKTEDNGDKSSYNSEIVLYEAENGNDEGLLVSVKNPEILGVAIICEGGDSAVIQSEIKNLVTSLFGIGFDRVYVGSKAA